MGRRKKDGKFVNCYISTVLADALDTASDETGISKTRIIEDSLTKHLNDLGYYSDNKQKSLFEPIFESGPEPENETVVDIPQETAKDSNKRDKKDGYDLSKCQAYLISEDGDIPCKILAELVIYGEPYYRIECNGEVQKVHRSFVQIKES